MSERERAWWRTNRFDLEIQTLAWEHADWWAKASPVERVRWEFGHRMYMAEMVAEIPGWIRDAVKECMDQNRGA